MEKLKLLSKICITLFGIFLSIEGALFGCFTYLKARGDNMSKQSELFLKTFPVTSSIVGNICGIFAIAFVVTCIRMLVFNRQR